MKNVFLALVLGSGFLAGSAIAGPAAARVKSPDGSLSVRETPNADGKVLKTLKNGDFVFIFELRDSSWDAVALKDGRRGYAEAKYFAKTIPQLFGEHMAETTIDSASGFATVYMEEDGELKAVGKLPNGAKISYNKDDVTGWFTVDDWPHKEKGFVWGYVSVFLTQLVEKR